MNLKVSLFFLLVLVLTNILGFSEHAKSDTTPILPRRFVNAPYCSSKFRKLNSELDSAVKTSKKLSSAQLLKKFKSYTLQPLGDEGELGFLFLSQDSEPDAPARKIIIPPNDWAPPFLKEEMWHEGENDYILVETGFKNLEPYSNYYHQLLKKYISEYPHENLEILYGSERVHAAHFLREHRWAMHDAVLNKYKLKKGYLTPEDFRILKVINESSSNSEVFGLLQASAEGEPRNLLSTIQVTYFGDFDFFNPSVRQFGRTLGFKPHDKEDRLPFEYRFETSQRAREFRTKFYSRFFARSTCEILRYGSFDANLPESVEDHLILKIFDRIIERGMKHIVIGVDNASGMFFSSRYNFQYFDQLPVPVKGDPEFLYYLDVDSPLFLKVYMRLKEQSHTVWVPSEMETE